MQKKLNRNVVVLWTILFCLTQLSGCSLVGPYKKDGAPDTNFDVSQIPDAVPKIEPLSRHGNKSYHIKGRHYQVLKTAFGYKARGIASWYGIKFHGRNTSSLEKYNLFAMTAASPTLPLPTYVKVKNLSNGKEVIVKVNDRGPFRSNRILDVSYVAAKKLGFADRGTARVEITAITPKQWEHPHFASAEKLYLKIGSFVTLSKAKVWAHKVALLTKSETHVAKTNQKIYHIAIGPVASNKTDQIRRVLRNKGFGEATI